MFSIYKIDKTLVYKRDINTKLKVLTNRGDDLRMYGSAMLDALCNEDRPIKHAYVVREGVCGQIAAWGACIQDHKNISGHVFVHPKFRGEGLAKRILDDMTTDYSNLVFYPISIAGHNLFKQFVPEESISDFYIRELISQ